MPLTSQAVLFSSSELSILGVGKHNFECSAYAMTIFQNSLLMDAAIKGLCVI